MLCDSIICNQKSRAFGVQFWYGFKEDFNGVALEVHGSITVTTPVLKVKHGMDRVRFVGSFHPDTELMAGKAFCLLTTNFLC